MAIKNRTFSVFPKPDNRDITTSVDKVEQEVREDRRTQKEINLELLKQIRLLNARIEEMGQTGIKEHDVKGEV